jgi:hypothetical protein
MKFMLEIDVDNDVFQSEYADLRFEVGLCLMRVRLGLTYTDDREGLIHDYNGNAVGTWRFTKECDDRMSPEEEDRQHSM